MDINFINCRCSGCVQSYRSAWSMRRRLRRNLETAVNQFYHSLKIFRRFWLAAIFRLILHKKIKNNQQYISTINRPFPRWCHFPHFFYQNPSGFCFPVQISQKGFCHFHLTWIWKWILVLIVKRLHRTNGLFVKIIDKISFGAGI